jgi:hypothetical protein
MFKKKNYVTETQLDHITNLIDKRIQGIELRSYGSPVNTYGYDKLVVLLIEAGILIENTEAPKPSVTWQGTKYNVRKVK